MTETPSHAILLARKHAADSVLRRLIFFYNDIQQWMHEAVQPIREGLHDDHEEVKALARAIDVVVKVERERCAAIATEMPCEEYPCDLLAATRMLHGQKIVAAIQEENS